MKLFTLFTTSLSFIPSLIAAATIPEVAARNETLVKRGGEVNYLCNCVRVDFSGPWPVSSYTASYIAWYSNIDNTHSGNDAITFTGKDRSRTSISLALGPLCRRTSTATLKAEGSRATLGGLNAPPTEKSSIAT
ncbi:hypothetical protein FRC00_012929, partial [Tulasnella sp. 408]